MTRLVHLAAVFLVSAPLFLAAGCKQGKGERCQVESDCEDGLTCVLSAGSTPQAGGTCQAPTGPSDLAVPPTADMTVVNDIGLE
jgi:hypothetical protein